MRSCCVNILRQMNMKRFFIILLLLLVAVYNATVFYVDRQLQKRDYAGVYNNCHKIWAARGLYNSRAEQNTPQAMQRAFSLGAIGAEVDVHFDLKRRKFIVSHDHPKKNKDGELVYPLKNGSLLFLEDFLKEVGKDHYFWLDFKNLGAFNDEQTAIVIQRLQEITQFDNIKERLYIEGSNPLLMPKYTNAGFKTIFGIHPIRESLFASSFVINVYKLGYYFSNSTVIGMANGKYVDDPVYGKKTRESLKNIPLFLFHVPNDEKLLHELMQIDNVRVVLVGKDLSINRYNIDACGANQE